jgi:phosphomannomutase
VLPTPGVAYLTGSLGADLGVMISASHNPMPDNGIKFLARGGVKLDDEALVTTAHLDLGCDDYLAEAERHVVLGATEVRRTPHWVTLRDPSGRVYCATRHQAGVPAV